jgi:hypothetical protein
MADVAGNVARLVESLTAARFERRPFAHWQFTDIFADELVAELVALPFASAIVPYVEGTRESNNDMRRYFDAPSCARFDACRMVADTLMDGDAVAVIEKTCGIDLAGSYLRIEYAQDRDGFWLAPHTDISVKLFTMLIYLSGEPAPGAWGTDIYADPDHHAATVPFVANRGMMFVPGADTWHGFRQRPIDGVRRSLIVNFVAAEWRARHELADATRPIG